MKAAVQHPNVKHLVLIGGGHSHLSVLKYFGMHPVPGLSLTLISRDINTPYSGSLPGHIAGVYSEEDIHIDLRPLAQFAGARIIQAEVERIDLVAKCIHIPGRPAIEFDLLSLNIGSRPNAIRIPGADKHAIGIKPIDRFLVAWQGIVKKAHRALKKEGQFKLVIVGGGPASVEFAFAAQLRLQQELAATGASANGLKIAIVSADSDVLLGHNAKVRQFIRQTLNTRNIELICDYLVTAFKRKQVVGEDGTAVDADAVVFATGASIPQWPGECGLALADDGFIEVNRHMQSTSHDFVFAAGDAATIVDHPRAKSGVYAVRQGKPLARNLARFATGRRLTTYSPQRSALALLNLGGGEALASRNQFCFHGRWVWALKNRIDTAFIRKYSHLPEPTPSRQVAAGLVDKTTELELQQHAMRCAGCAAKLSADTLGTVLRGLPESNNPDLLNGPGDIEDAALIRLDADRVLVQTVDQLKAFINDPWLFARIATNHCLSDIYAMGCRPHTALAVVGIPYASKTLMKNQMTELMAGCVTELQAADCTLAGGHSAESQDLLFGLCVNGFAHPDRLLTKQGLRSGDVMILTKPLGTGTLLAADMRFKASHAWIDTALDHMVMSNAAAVDVLLAHEASACTDITGFGLAGHLLEMLNPVAGSAEVILDALPVLPGAVECLERGISSTLHGENSRNGDQVFNLEAFSDSQLSQILYDPQTAGGLLAGVSPERADACLSQLRQAGYSQAAIIGHVAATNGSAGALILV